MIIQIKRYLKQYRQAGISELAWHFKLSPDVVKSMLDYLLERGCVSLTSGASSICGTGCGQCSQGCESTYIFCE